MFIKMGDGTIVPMSNIKAIDSPTSKEGQSKAWTSNSQSYHCRDSIDYLEIMSMPVIPALPGFVMLVWHDDYEADGFGGYTHTPIIGWRINESESIPITNDWWDNQYAYDARYHAAEVAIVWPDGRVNVPGHCVCNKVEDWAGDMRKKHDKPKAAE